MAPLLEVNDLSIGFGAGPPVVDRVSFALNAGETLALVVMPVCTTFAAGCSSDARRLDPI